MDPSALQNKKQHWARGKGGRFISAPKSFEWLLKDPLVRDWIDSYTSFESREKKLYQLEKVIRAGRLSGAGELLGLADRDIKILVRRVANWYLQQGKAVWAKQITITIKGFLEAQDRTLNIKRSERIRTSLRKIAIEHVPTKQEVYELSENMGSLRDRAIILALFQCGVRVSCLCNWTYELLATQLYPEIRIPIRLKITPNLDTKLSLHGLSYYVTGLREDAALAIRDYLDFRKKQGWIPQSSDPIFVRVDEAGQPRKITRETVWRMVKSSAKKSGLNPESVWVHCLRKSFRKVLNATSQIDEDTKEALMGHKLPGSRGNYFDYHDENEVMTKYMQADFSRPVPFVYDLPQ